MSVTKAEYERARYVCEPAAALLRQAMRRDSRGPRGLDPLIYLVGAYLSLQTRKSATVQSILRTLLRDLPRDVQWDLGVRRGNPDNPWVLSQTALYNFTRGLRRIEYGVARHPELSDHERRARFERVQAISQALLKQTLIPRPDGSADYAVDGTGIDAPERGHRKPKNLPDLDGHEEDLGTLEIEPVTPAPSPTGKGSKGPSDAAWGWRTGHTERSVYYGYDIEGLIRVPAVGQRGDKRNEPALLAALTVLPAGSDVVEPVLGMIDRLKHDQTPIRKLLNDRHYSYKAYDRWLLELMKRNVQQVSDLRSDDHGFTDWNGLRIAAGHPHCPATGDEYATIPAPAPAATEEERAAFTNRIEERRAFALQIVNRPTADNQRLKCRCPARYGTVGCPLVDGTVAVAIEAGLPIVKNPPAEPIRPAACRQDTVTLRIENEDQKKVMKAMQSHYWGSQQWQEDYARRTHIEGYFGCLQNAEIGTVSADTHQHRGLAISTIIYSLAAALSNAHILRLWHQQTKLGDPKHPLLKADPPFYGFKELTRDEAQAIDRAGAARQTRLLHSVA